MKAEIHPKYAAASIHCACGNVIETRSTIAGVIQVEICSACHPFFTGKQKLMDTAGRIDRFQKKFAGKLAHGQKALKQEAPAVPLRKEPKVNPIQEKLKSAKEKLGKK